MGSSLRSGITRALLGGAAASLLLALMSCGDEAQRNGGGPLAGDPLHDDAVGGDCGSAVRCGDACVDTSSDAAHCGDCLNACPSGISCVAGTCACGPSGCSGSVNEGPIDPVLDPGTDPTPPPGAAACQVGSADTVWASSCQTEVAQTCAPGAFVSWGSSAPENYPLRYETEHFAFLWPDERDVDLADVQEAGAFMEDVLWNNYLGSPMFWPEPDCDRTDKRKTSVHIIEGGLFGGCNAGRPGIWVGPGAMRDHWGLGHEWAHSLQCMTPGFPECGAGGCWLNESHANFMSHQLPEYREDVHCSETLENMPHLYYGSTRDRYCNWQFFEFLKDKHCYSAVNEMWTADAVDGEGDPWGKLARNMGWGIEQLNDAFGEWAMHNITWDYQNPRPPRAAIRAPSTVVSTPASRTSPARSAAAG